jgi:hypothetical protein
MTIYYEAGIPASLIPVTFIGWAPTPAHDLTGLYNVVIRLKRASPYYPAGETLHVPARSVVVKAGVRDYRILVREASLPARTDANTLNPRS